jgi:hypothetical protein
MLRRVPHLRDDERRQRRDGRRCRNGRIAASQIPAINDHLIS